MPLKGGDQTMNDSQIIRAAEAFDLPSGPLSAQPFGNGHINKTYAISVPGREERWLLQRINDHVFPHPDQVQENIQAVTAHLRQKIAEAGGDPERETLRVIPTRDGSSFYRDPEGGWWRLFPLISGSFSRDLPESPEMFAECGRAFGRFQRMLADFPAATLHEVIPAFHDTPGRLRQLEEAARKNVAGRLSSVRAELDFCLSRAAETSLLTDQLAAGKLPLRVTHNDTKLNNVLLDQATGAALCVVDLDTVMPGLAAYDFGEAVRTGACTAPEDERDLSKIQLSLLLYRAYAEGFLSQLGDSMTREEMLSLPRGARMMTLENAMRFLADYLNGDVYYAVHRKDHNLDRARAQMTLLRRMEEHWDEMQSIL